MKRITFIISAIIALTSCSDGRVTMIGENTFIHREKVFRIIENEVTELANLKSDSITKSTVLNPTLKDYGTFGLAYVEKGASVKIY